MVSAQTATGFIQMDKLIHELSNLKSAYQSNNPYPHIVIDQFLETAAAKKAMAFFPKVKDAG